jgi:hypothetical protein
MRILIAAIGALSLGGCATHGPASNFTDMVAQIVGHKQSCVASVSELNHEVLPRCFNPKPAMQSNPSVQAHSTQRQTVNVDRASPPTPGASFAAAPSGIPVFDVKVSCHAADNLPIDQHFDRCLLTEGGARDQLTQNWTEFPIADRSRCVRYSSTGGGGTYTDLLTCLEMELNARNLQIKNRSVARQ